MNGDFRLAAVCHGTGEERNHEKEGNQPQGGIEGLLA